MGMSIRTKNILTALVAVVVVGGFIFVAEGLKKDTKDDRLAAIENATTTTVKRTTTTREPTTTTSSTVLSTSTTSAASLTTTTVKKTTTTRASTTATTRRTTTTVPSAAPVPHDGPGTEASDNTATFTRNADGSFSTNGAAACPSTERTDPFCFNIGTEGGISLVVEIRNNTARTIKFPNGSLKILVNLQNPNGTTSQFVMDASALGATLAPHEGARIKSSAQISDTGQYSFTASCEIDYGP